MKPTIFYSTAIFYFTFLLFLSLPTNVKKEKTKIYTEHTQKETKALSLNMHSWAPVIEKAIPAVVVITTEATLQPPPLELKGLPKRFRYFYLLPPEKQMGQGSGFIISEDGYVITNHHVIDSAEKIKLKVGTSLKEYSATVIGSDEYHDIALLKILPEKDEDGQNLPPKKWPFLPLGNSYQTRIGDSILALGSPLGLLQSASEGILSNESRSGLRPSGRPVAKMWQVAVTIGPGSSGGPMLNDSGEVVAVSESVVANSPIAFGVPIDDVKEIIPDLLAYGSAQKAFLGVLTKDTNLSHLDELNKISTQDIYVVIKNTLPESPARKAGIMPGDILLKIGQEPIHSSEKLKEIVNSNGPGKKIFITVFRLRENKILTFEVVLKKKPDLFQ